MMMMMMMMMMVTTIMIMIMNVHDHDEPRIVIRVSSLFTATLRLGWQRNGIHPPALRLCFGLEVVLSPAPHMHKQCQLPIFLWNVLWDDIALRTQIVRVLNFRAWSCTVGMHNLTNSSKERFLSWIWTQEKRKPAQGYGLVKHCANSKHFRFLLMRCRQQKWANLPVCMLIPQAASSGMDDTCTEPQRMVTWKYWLIAVIRIGRSAVGHQRVAAG